jgi:hypothetical protein
MFACSAYLKSGDRTILASACALPGCDPRDLVTKVCQDNCCFMSDGEAVLIALFDGHGGFGEFVARNCV